MSRTGIPPVWDPDEVTPSWLQEVIAAAGLLGEQEVISVDAEQIGTGQVGCNVRYRIRYDRPGPAPGSVVGKFASRSEVSRATGVQTLTYETEVAFYRDLAHTVEVSRPRCLHADIEPGTSDVVLILEDIDGEPGDQLTGCREDQVVLAVTEAARLHGPRWGDPSLAEVPWLAAKADNAIDAGAAIAMLWPTFLDRYGESLSEQSVELGTAIARSSAWPKPSDTPRTLCHVDYRLDNMLFGRPGTDRPLTVVDWQTVSLGTGPADVAYFMSAAVTPEVRREIERDMVALYHERLVSYGVGDYDLIRCWDDYRRGSFSGFAMAVFASMMVGRTDRGDRMFVTMADGAAAQVFDLDATAYLA